MIKNDNTIILITGVCGDIGCSVVRALHDESRTIIGCDMKQGSPVGHMLKKMYAVPGAADGTNYLKNMKEIVAKEKISVLLPISEPEIKLVNEERKELEFWGLKLLINNSVVIDNFLDKLKTANYLSEIGVTVPRTAMLHDYKGTFGFPLIIKHRTGYGSKKLWRADNAEDLRYLTRKYDDGMLVVQECIGSDSEEYTTGVFSDGINVSSITFQRKLGFGGLSAEACLVNHAAIERLAEKVAHAVKLKGSINIQSRRVDNTFIPFEINPRLSSTVLIRKKFGFDDAVWWLNALSGKPYQYRQAYRSGKAIRCVSECYFDMVKYEDE